MKKYKRTFRKKKSRETKAQIGYKYHMDKIRLLDEETINQIAAGEVLEDCASCVKELVENAIDAKATLITVHTEEGGLGFITVADNGEGISKEDLPSAILRHATSKIRRASDLLLAGSFGFRGEALASIAAVSHLEIKSTCRGESWQLIATGGKIQSIKPTVRQQGTTITVKSLFHNVYARSQFQKSVNKQNIQINKILIQLLLFAEGTGLEWISEGKRRFVIAPYLSLKERIILFHGDAFFAQLVPIFYEKKPFSVTGFMGNLSSYRAQKSHDYLFLNRKFVQNKEIYSMILEGYATRLPEKRYPPFVCNLSLPPDLFDRNVHPQKKEIRLKEEESLKNFFLEAINHLFLPKKQTPIVFPSLSLKNTAELAKTFERKAVKVAENISLKKVKVLKIFGAYVLFEKEEKWYLLSLKRASQYLTEKKISQLKMKEHLESQRLVVPFSYSCSFEEAELLEKRLEELEKYGFSLRMLGKDTFLVESIATGFTENATKEFLDNLGKQKIEKEIRDKIKNFFFQKKSFVPHAEEQILYLIEELSKYDPPYLLDRGKKVLCEFDDQLIERMMV